MQNSEKTFGYRAQASEAKNGFEKKRFFSSKSLERERGERKKHFS
jgi:hypothetical protein